ncbi:MAG TPA: response regulator [Abditibacteriaceae bacterium]|jgi:signal transduction histidine kinase
MTPLFPAGDISGSPGRILLIDDTPANVRLLSSILRLEGFEIVTAHSGIEGLERVTESEIDVVLLDIMMPGMDGFEVCQRLRANEATAHLPVVMVTALQERVDRVRAIEAGADDFLSKPVDAVEVVARTRSLVRAKRERDALKQAYLDVQRSESLRDSLVHMLVHDLRTPLTTMMVTLEMLRSGQTGKLDKMQQEIANLCASGSRQLLDMVNQMLDLNKLENGEMQLHLEEIKPLDVIEATVAIVLPLARDCETEVLINLIEDAPIRADADLLRRILLNLLSNAIKFSPSRSRIEVEAKREKDAWLFCVRDNGDGLNPDEQELIFDKFGQIKAGPEKRANSTGLGLTFCKLAVEAHKGRIWVESEVGKGSEFLFTIPQ